MSASHVVRFGSKLRRTIAFASVFAAGGCSLLLGLDPPGYDSADPDATTEDAPQPDTGLRADTDVSDAPDIDGGPAAAAFSDPTRWSTYAGAIGGGYVTGAFDGRYAYFIRARDPDAADAGEPSARILRYDTQAEADFDKDSAWSSFEPRLVSPGIGVQQSATFDGRYFIVAGYQSGVFMRFDTTQPATFTQPSAWELFDAKTISPTAVLYAGAAHLDGGTYYAPFNSTRPFLQHRGATFDGGWQSFTPATLACVTGRTASCLGPYIYFGPSNGGAGAADCLVRHDTRQPFADGGFEAFQLSSLSPTYRDFIGTVATPEHLYLTRFTSPEAGAPLHFLQKSGASAFDAGWEAQRTDAKDPLASGYLGGTFDGRYVYFAPFPNGGAPIIYQRYDTTQPFTSTTSWQTVPGVTLGISETSHQGALFDGKYIYYPPYVSLTAGKPPLMVRFKAYDTKVTVPSRCGYQ